MNIKPTILIYFDIIEFFGIETKDMYYRGFCRFAEFCKVRGSEVIVSIGDTYMGDMQFSKGYKYQNGEFVPFIGPFKVDLIYLKGKQNTLQSGENDLVVCHPTLEAIDDDKLMTYQFLGKYMAKTWPITPENCEAVIDEIKTDKLVLKPVTGTDGRGVFICEKDSFNLKNYDISEPYLVQEFIDSSKGVPGITEGNHDLRMILFENNVKLAFVKIPPTGSLVSNLSIGGLVKILDIADLPESALTLAKEVDECLNEFYPRIYTIDVMYQDGKPFLTEINTGPSFSSVELKGQEYIDKFDGYLLEELLRLIEEKTKKLP